MPNTTSRQPLKIIREPTTTYLGNLVSARSLQQCFLTLRWNLLYFNLCHGPAALVVPRPRRAASLPALSPIPAPARRCRFKGRRAVPWCTAAGARRAAWPASVRALGAAARCAGGGGRDAGLRRRDRSTDPLTQRPGPRRRLPAPLSGSSRRSRRRRHVYGLLLRRGHPGLHGGRRSRRRRSSSRGFFLRNRHAEVTRLPAPLGSPVPAAPRGLRPPRGPGPSLNAGGGGGPCVCEGARLCSGLGASPAPEGARGSGGPGRRALGAPCLSRPPLPCLLLRL